MNFLGFFGNLGPTELIIILAILLLLFGGSRLPQLAGGLGKSIRSFKRGMAEGAEDESDLEEARRRGELRAGSTSLEDEHLAANKATLNRPR